MAKKRSGRPPPPGRYAIDEITARVERERIRADLAVKDLADRVGLSEWVWYKRADLSHPFSVEELGRIADVLGMPPLWPFAERTVLEGLFRGRPVNK